MKDVVEKLTRGVIDGPEDLMGMGECLNLLEQLETASYFPADVAGLLPEVKKVLGRIILRESSDIEKDWQSVRQMIQELCDRGNGAPAGPPDSVLDPDLEAIRILIQDQDSKESHPSRLGSGGGDPRGGEEAFAETEGSSEGPTEGMNLQDPELVKDFIEEAREHLASIELNILALETDPKDQNAINAIFRPFHSIKGVAGFLNLKDIHHLSHEVENLLDSARSNEILITDDAIDLILKAVDLLKILIGVLENSMVEGAALPSNAEVVEAFLKRLRAFQEQPADGESPVRKLGEILVERGIIENQAVEVGKSSGKRPGEQLINDGMVGPREVSSALREQRRSKENAASVRIDTHKLDNLVDMVGELVIAQSMVLQNSEVEAIKDQKFQKDTVQLRRITNELQRISMAMRMVPIKSTFQKMIRLVRDLSRKSGKEVVLEMKGEETEIDRNMVEEIYEPLVHMIRNSIDHGIEYPEERLAAGKACPGVILIAAEQKGGNIVIEIRDDGRGLDTEKIRATAIRREIISADEQLDERAIHELIFHPGFSTTDKITEVSGRGVGMDVVKKSVERLRGKVEISSERGRGTRFEMKLPLTMAIIDGMIIHVGNHRYVVPTISMKESLRPAQAAYQTIHGRGETIKVRNSLMPLIRLHQIFGVEPKYRDPWDGLLLVVNEDNRSYCLQADEIVGRQEVVIKSLGSSLRHVVGISGGAILGDGRVALILDVKGIVSHYEGNS